MSDSSLRWHIDKRLEIERRVRDEIARRAAKGIQNRGVFSIVLSGGTTPRSLYASLITLPSPSW
ncbi:MAG TPA: 6-phosphogluconolactonase, partial [Gammaproteobacteria bacterium]|nr:6-phosphogluconolactonase [Gammaproteobacteria bacterium]